MTTPTSVHSLHSGPAEAGKLLALQGRHAQALERYREALRIAQAVRAPPCFARHSLHGVLESLEHMGAHAQAAALAESAASAAANPEPSDFQRRDRAHLLERQGVNQLKGGDVPAARATLESALKLDNELPCARMLLDWTARGLSVSPSRLAEAQRKYGYFTVRKDAIDPARTRHPQHLTTEF